MTETRALRAYADVALGRQRSPGNDTGPFMVPYLRAANVNDGALDLSDVKVMNFTPNEQVVFSLKRGDVLVTEGSGSLGAVGASAVWNEDVTGTFCFQNTLLRLRPRPGTDPRFLAWWCRHAFADGLFASVATGANIFHVSADRVRSLRMTYLPLPVQRGVADYLDRETARIDSIIGAKRRMVALLEEQFWASVTEQILSGAPASLPLRRFITHISDGPFGSSLTSSDYSDSGARVVRLGNLGLAEFRQGDAAFIAHDYFLTLLRHRVREGDLLIAGLGDANNHVGRACVAPDLGPAIVKADCYCAHVDGARVTAPFLALYLSSPLGASSVALTARGTTRSRINLDIAKEIPVPSLSVDSQRQIVAGAQRRRARATTITRNLTSQIGLLQERRQALITAAVTGQFDIPEAA